MGKVVNAIVRLVEAGRQSYARKWSFLGLFAVAFIGSVALLGALDLLPSTKSDLVLGLPEAPPSATAPTITLAESKKDAVPEAPELPAKITISAIGIEANIVNPTTTGIEALDKELLKGAVRYPTSAKLGETGNVVLFGHSSYLPVVNNQAYKTFNGIQKLVVGDVVTVYSSNTAYTYRVRSVAKENADNNTAIQLSVDDKILTLVTCNSFGAKEDRFIVTADFVESHPAGS